MLAVHALAFVSPAGGLASALQRRVVCNERSLGETRCLWTSLDPTMVQHVNAMYFKAHPREEWRCDIFLVEGVPAASLLYDGFDAHTHMPLAKEFYMRKSLLLLFDAGPCMCQLLFKRYKHLDMRTCINRDELLLFSQDL